MKVQWREHLSVGMEEVDEQHRRLFDAFNAFVAACDSGKGKEEVTRVFDFLDAYVIIHFAAEERLQRRFGFPDYERHREVHKKFIGELADMKVRLSSEGATLPLVIATGRVMAGWLIEHISGMDRNFGRFVREQEMGAA
ncbi:MAG: hemerythrin family protein [Geobacter sp.]|nr:hemerythrin family protein [Geobacter sp.]